MRRGGLWRNADFVHLWGAATVSTFGSLVTRTALPFTAILLLDATACRPRRAAHRRVAARLSWSGSSPGPGSIACAAARS